MEIHSRDISINSFFDFLKNHINKEFAKLKKEYDEETYNFDEFGKKVLDLDENNYLIIFPKDLRDEAILDGLKFEGKAYRMSLDKDKQRKFKKIDGVDEPLEYSLHNDLSLLYNRERIKFFDNFTERLSDGFPSTELRKTFIEDVIKRLEFNCQKVKNSSFSVKDEKGNDCFLLHIKLTELIQKIQKDYLIEKFSNYQSLNANSKKQKGKQPHAKILMAFIRIIDGNKKEFYPRESEFSNNDEKFEIIAARVKEKFNFIYSGGTLENNDDKIKGYSLDVYNRYCTEMYDDF